MTCDFKAETEADLINACQRAPAKHRVERFNATNLAWMTRTS